MRCLRCLTFVLTSLAVTYIPVLFDLFLSSDTSICSTMGFAPLGNSDHVVVSVSIDFLPNSKRNAPFHCIAYYYSYADWDSLHDHLRDVPWEDIFKFSASVAASEFCEWFKPHPFPWFSVTCDVATVHRNTFFHLYQQNKSSESEVTGY